MMFDVVCLYGIHLTLHACMVAGVYDVGMPLYSYVYVIGTRLHADMSGIGAPFYICMHVWHMYHHFVLCLSVMDNIGMCLCEVRHYYELLYIACNPFFS